MKRHDEGSKGWTRASQADTCFQVPGLPLRAQTDQINGIKQTMATHLITGGAGFIGSHLSDYLLQRGEQVIVIDNLSTGRYNNIEHLEGRSGFKCYIEDVRHETLIDELIRQCDRVYHLAASVGVRLIIEKPTESLINNIVSTERVLSSASRYRKPVLITSTSE